MAKKELADRNDRSSNKPKLQKTKSDEEAELLQAHSSTIIQQAGLDPRLLAPHNVEQLQRTIGNRATGQLLAGSSPLLQRQELSEEDQELQLKPDIPVVGPEGGPVAPEVQAAIQNAKGGGQPLQETIQAQMGETLDHDFRDVRVHTGGQADALNQALGARAFTTGQDIFFRQGEYNPNSDSDQELIAHELSHVVQQNIGRVNGGGSAMTVRPAGDALEQEAETLSRHMASAASHGQPLPGTSPPVRAIPGYISVRQERHVSPEPLHTSTDTTWCDTRQRSEVVQRATIPLEDKEDPKKLEVDDSLADSFSKALQQGPLKAYITSILPVLPDTITVTRSEEPTAYDHEKKELRWNPSTPHATGGGTAGTIAHELGHAAQSGDLRKKCEILGGKQDSWMSEVIWDVIMDKSGESGQGVKETPGGIFIEWDNMIRNEYRFALQSGQSAVRKRYTAKPEDITGTVSSVAADLLKVERDIFSKVMELYNKVVEVAKRRKAIAGQEFVREPRLLRDFSLEKSSPLWSASAQNLENIEKSQKDYKDAGQLLGEHEAVVNMLTNLEAHEAWARGEIE